MSGYVIRVSEDREVPGSPFTLTVDGYPFGGYSGHSVAHVLRQLADEWERFPIGNFVGLVTEEARLARVEALHRRAWSSDGCNSCGFHWPCPTIHAIRGTS